MPSGPAHFQLEKRLLKFTRGEGLFDLLPRGCMCGSLVVNNVSENHDYFSMPFSDR